MSGKKNRLVTLGFVLSVSLIAAAVSVLLTSFYCSRLSFDLLNGVCSEVAEQDPETKKVISVALKEYTEGNSANGKKEDVLPALGYSAADFPGITRGQQGLFAAAGFLAGGLLFIFTFLYRNKRETARIRSLTEYLEQANTGRAAVLSASGEDDFSKLEDEIYKTVTFLYQTKDSAVQAKNNFAENLSNIAHQIKTPLTAASLSVQMMKQETAEESSLCPDGSASGGMHADSAKAESFRRKHLEQTEKQLLRLARLEEALLVLSRMDAGTLPLQKDEVDVFTLLVLAADNLQELFAGTGASVEIPELGGMRILADLEWTMEAVMNLMKNCMEHSPQGTVHCSYAQNPLYTEILIWDEGKGFAQEDLPHLFERFYRGQNAGEGGIGIGLALAREIMERQNGILRAKNRPEGGALFEIRFYSH